jgi:hypothetical protein
MPYLDAVDPMPARYVLCDAQHGTKPVRCTRRTGHVGKHQGWLADGDTAPEDMVPIVWDTGLHLETHTAESAG